MAASPLRKDTSGSEHDEAGKYVAHYVMYTDDFFLEDSVESVYPFVDKILIARTMKPWAGKPVNLEDTELSLAKISSRFGDKVEIFAGEFPDEHSQRNFLLDLSKSRNHRGAFIIDCDEVFIDNSFPAMYSFIEKNDPAALRVPYLTFVKDASFSISPPYETGLFYIKLAADAHFTHARSLNVDETMMPYDSPDILHFSYIRKDDRAIWQKVTTFMHVNDTDWSKWYNETYLAFGQHLKNFHPVWPESWSGVQLFDISRFPQNLYDKLKDNQKLFYNQRVTDAAGVKLHLGCGPDIRPGYINVDLYNPAAELKLDITSLGYFRDESVDEIFMNAVLEHLWSFEQVRALKEWRRVLKPGGKLIINSIPDFDVIVRAFTRHEAGNIGDRFDLYNVYRYSHGDPSPENRFGQIHKDVFTRDKVRDLLTSAGFEIQNMENVRWKDEPVECNLNIVARKPVMSERAEIQKIIEEAERSIQTKRYDHAEYILIDLLSKFPSNTDALNDLAVLYMLVGLRDEAADVLKRVLEVDPTNKIALDNLKVFQRSAVDPAPGESVQHTGTPEQAGRPADEEGKSARALHFEDPPLVSVIIPVFNQVECTKKCVDAIERNTMYPNYEVVIVNNASTDGTADFLQQVESKDSHFHAIHSDENLGFVDGCNLAAEQARGKYILFLNNDTEVNPGWLEQLVAFAESHDDCGAVGSKLIYPDGTLQEAGGMIFSDGSGGNFGRTKDPSGAAYNEVMEVDYCSGASLLVKTELFKKLGGFDRRYVPAYSEDADLCFALRKEGYKVYYQPESSVVHYESITSGTDDNAGFKRYLGINRRKFIEKWNQELLQQDEPPSENNFVAQSGDRSRLLDGAGHTRFKYRRRYLFSGLPGYPENVLSYFPSLTRHEEKSGLVKMLYDVEVLSALASAYGFPWLYGRAYLEGRYLRMSEVYQKRELSIELQAEISNAKGLARLLAPRQTSFMGDLLKLEITPEPIRSLFFIQSGEKTLTGVNALNELYHLAVRYAFLRGVSDFNDGLAEEEGVRAIEELLDAGYTSRRELPGYMTGTGKPVAKFSYKSSQSHKRNTLRVLAFYPHNPYPPRTGADNGFIGVIDALQDLGCEVSLISSTFFTDKPWRIRETEDFCRQKNINIYLHQADEEDNIYVRSMQMMGKSKMWDMKIPDGLRKSFSEVYDEVSPDVVLINYAWWGRLIDDPKYSGSVKVIQMHDLLSLNEKMQDAARQLVCHPPYDVNGVRPEALVEDVFARFNLTGDEDEYKVYDNYDYVIAVSDREMERIKAHASHTNPIVIPAPLGSRNFVEENTYGGYPLFAIANNVFNVQAYLYFVKKVLPLIRKEIPKFQLNVVGDGCKELQKSDGVNLLGFVDDIMSLYRNSCFAIAPMIGGTGQSVKVLEAMANGLPVVSLNNSYQVCSVHHGVDGFTASSAREFADHVIRLYEDRDLCRSMGANARKGISRNYSYKKIVEALKPLIQLVGQQRSRLSRVRNKNRKLEWKGVNLLQAGVDPDELVKRSLEKADGNVVYLSESVFGLRSTPPLDLMERFLNSLPPFYVHFGGIGDALLLLSTFYDKDPGETIVSFANSKETMGGFFRSFEGLKKVYVLNMPNEPGVHQLLRFMIHRTQKCKGMGTTPLYEYGVEWNVNVDIFEKYGVMKNPKWINLLNTRKTQGFQVTIQPKGSLKGMVASKQNVIDPRYWHKLLEFLSSKSITPIILGTPNERKEYPALEGCIDERSCDLKRQIELVASSDVVIGADSWAKTLSGLSSIPTIVFRTVRGKELENWQDPADNVFIRPWDSIQVARDEKEFESLFSDLLSKLQPAGLIDNVPLKPKNGLKPPERPRVGTDLSESGRKFVINWEGSQFVHHSMALINREICLQLIDRGHDVSIIPYEKDEYDHRVDRRYEEIARRMSKIHERPVDVHIRHQWPPNLVPPVEGHWVMIQPWEFGSLPTDWIETMNSYVDEVWVPTTFVRDCYIRSGLDDQRILVVPNGVNTDRFNPNAKPFRLTTRKKFKFLYVGGTIKRKGIDLLLNTYLKTFSRKDDVCLIIKDLLGDSFYRGQTIEEDLKRISSNPSLPEVEYINSKFSEAQMAGLYTSADCLVHPYRGEGFGLPIAEALAAELPVIVTGYGAAMDFCNQDNSYLLPSKVIYYEEKRVGNRETVDYPWLAEPDPEVLAEAMRIVFNSPQTARSKAKSGRELIESRFSWKKIGTIVEERISEISKKPVVRFGDSQVKLKQQRDYKLAQELLQKGLVEEAAEKLERLAISGSISAANDLAIAYAILGRTEDAEEKLKRILDANPALTFVKKNLASIYSRSNRFEEAVKLYGEVLAMTPFDIDVLNSLGTICLQMGKVGQAREFFSISLQRDPQNMMAKNRIKEMETQMA